MDKNRSICRICLFECNKRLSLFEEQNATRYSDLIKEYTGIELVEKHNLPTGLCKDCEFEIKTVIKFISKVRLANERLNEVITWNIPVMFSSSIKYEVRDSDTTKYGRTSFQVEHKNTDRKLCFKHEDDVCLSGVETCPDNKIFLTVISEDDSEAELSLLDLKNKKKHKKHKDKHNKQRRSKMEHHLNSNEMRYKANQFLDAENNISDDNLDTLDTAFHDNSDNESLKLDIQKSNSEIVNYKSELDNRLAEVDGRSNILDSQIKTEDIYLLDVRNGISNDKHNSMDCKNEDGDTKKKESDLDSKYVILKKSEHCLMKDMIKCLTCGILSLNKSAFIVHYRKHTGEKPHKCKHCKMKYSQVGTLNAHIRKRHPKEWNKMKMLAKKLKEMRDREFLEKCAAEPDVKIEDEQADGGGKNDDKRKNMRRRVICDICGKSYYHKYALNLHMRVHNVADQIQCQYCPQRFVRTGDRILHVRVHHTGEKPYCCHMCGKAFASGTNLKKHLVVHSDERKFKCEVCGKGMKSKDNLKRHMLVMHEGIKSKVCHICGKGFALQYRLNVHMKNCHENKNSALCEICKKSFRNIDKHMRRHTGDKPHKCTMCHKTFFQEKHLLGHIKKHQNESATFKCTYENCASAFSKKCVLEYHVLKYHLKHTPHVCQYCNRGFYRTKDLGKHMKSTHNIKLEFSVTNDFSSN